MARHNKILEHKMNCPQCGILWKAEYFELLLFNLGQEQINLVCNCKTRLTIKENINGFLVMRKYIMKKDKVKRIVK